MASGINEIHSQIKGTISFVQGYFPELDQVVIDDNLFVIAGPLGRVIPVRVHQKDMIAGPGQPAVITLHFRKWNEDAAPLSHPG